MIMERDAAQQIHNTNDTDTDIELTEQSTLLHATVSFDRNLFH